MQEKDLNSTCQVSGLFRFQLAQFKSGYVPSEDLLRLYSCLYFGVLVFPKTFEFVETKNLKKFFPSFCAERVRECVSLSFLTNC